MTATREDTRKQILDCARKVFLEHGLFETSMEDIAALSGIARRTVYRYFTSKEDIAFEVSCEIIHDLNRYQERIFKSLQGAGIDRFKTFLAKFVRYLGTHEEIMRFMGEFDFYFKDGSSFVPKESLSARYDILIHESNGMLGEILEGGIKDGSIKESIDIALSVFTISNILWGFGQRLAARKEHLREEYKINPIKLIFHQIDLYALALAREKGQEKR